MMKVVAPRRSPDPTRPSHLEGAPFWKNETSGLVEPRGFRSLGEAAERSTKHNQELIAAIPQWQEWRRSAGRIKHYAISNLDKLLVEFERNIAARGATVLWAQNAREANQYVLDIAREHNVKTVVKSKS